MRADRCRCGRWKWAHKRFCPWCGVWAEFDTISLKQFEALNASLPRVPRHQSDPLVTGALSGSNERIGSYGS